MKDINRLKEARKQVRICMENQDHYGMLGNIEMLLSDLIEHEENNG